MRLNRLLPAGCGAAVLALCSAAPALAGGASKPSAPVIHEKFTPLGCPGKPMTTLQIEGCAEHKVLAIDKTIDGLAAKVFARLKGSSRATFVAASGDWLQYRNAACAAEASIYNGGSVQPVAYANCLVSLDGSHVSDLKHILLTVSLGG